MRLEARLVENDWYKGRWGDELDYAILAREWRQGGLPPS
jgi:RimJ/RimL family protein N-acetyltransferase